MRKNKFSFVKNITCHYVIEQFCSPYTYDKYTVLSTVINLATQLKHLFIVILEEAQYEI